MKLLLLVSPVDAYTEAGTGGTRILLPFLVNPQHVYA